MKSIQKNLFKILKYSFCLAFIGALICCKKPATPTLGTDVQPEGDALFSIVSDTTTLKIHTIRYDSSRSYQDQFKYLGSNQDPIFGRTNASIFTNISLPNSVSNISFGDDAVLDSAELILTFTQSFVGDSATPLLYEAHQLTQDLSRANSYYMHTTVQYNSNLLSSAIRKTTLTSGFYTVRLPLNSAYASAMITNPQYLVDNATFQSTYKGFYITTKNTNLTPSAQGALMKMDLDNPVSGVYMYYHNGGFSSSKVPKTYRFPFSGDNSSRFNNISYDYHSGGNNMLVNQLDKIDTLAKQDLFLKGVAGTKNIIRLPFLKNYSDSCPIAVNRAELYFKVDQAFLDDNPGYQPPLKISLVGIDQMGREIFMKDQYYGGDLIRFGGSYDPINKWYIFNIARHVQDIMSGKLANYGFYLVVANPDPSYLVRRDDRAERVVFGGLNNALYKPTFRLVYIRFPYDK